MSTKRKVVLITGGSRGIGLGIARCLATSDCDLAINGVREESAVSEALNELRGLGADVIYCQGDVSSSSDRDGILDAIRQKFGRLQVLVNNAGIAPPARKDVLEADEASFDRVLSVNLKGPYFLTQSVARWMIEQRDTQGRPGMCVINVSSVSAEVASTNRGDYCLSKAGIGMATKLWAARLAEFDIPVYEIRPGIIESDMTAGVKEKYDTLIAGGLTLQKRWGRPEDIGKVAAMLVRGELPYATGQVLNVDGGMGVRVL